MKYNNTYYIQDGWLYDIYGRIMPYNKLRALSSSDLEKLLMRRDVKFRKRFKLEEVRR